MPPIFISAEGEVTRLSDGDIPVGMFPDATFQEHRITVPPGSSIVVYTDGVSDALNSEGEEFGEERIMRCLTSLPKPIEAEGICKHLAGRVAEWAGSADRSDDTTILALTVDCQPSKHKAVRDDNLDLGANAGRACNSATDPKFADPVHFQNPEEVKNSGVTRPIHDHRTVEIIPNGPKPS
jgi:hypothetical protein